MSKRMSALEIKKGNKGFVVRFTLRGENYGEDAGYSAAVTTWYLDDDDDSVTKVVDAASCTASYSAAAYQGQGATYVDFLVNAAATATAGDYFAEVNFLQGGEIRDTKTFMWKVIQGSR